jgi:hypothetical protein
MKIAIQSWLICIGLLGASSEALAQACTVIPEVGGDGTPRGVRCLQDGAACSTSFLNATRSGHCSTVVRADATHSCECDIFPHVVRPHGPTPSYSLSSDGLFPLVVPAVFGGLATSTLTITPSNGYTQDVSLECIVLTPSNGQVSCTTVPATVVKGAGTAQLRVTISPETPKGTYAFRVAAIDKSGLRPTGALPQVAVSVGVGATPITYSEMVVGATGTLAGKPFGSADGTANLTLIYRSYTANVLSYSVRGPHWPGVGFENLGGAAFVVARDPQSFEHILFSAMFSPDERIFVSVDNANEGFGIGSHGRRPSDVDFGTSILPLYPYALFLVQLPTPPDLQSNVPITFPIQPAASSCIGFPDTLCQPAIPLATNIGALTFDPSGVFSPSQNQLEGGFCMQTGGFDMVVSPPAAPVVLGGAKGLVQVLLTPTDGYTGDSPGPSCNVSATGTPAQCETFQSVQPDGAWQLWVTPLAIGTIGLTIDASGSCNVGPNGGPQTISVTAVAPPNASGGSAVAVFTFVGLVGLWGLFQFLRRSGFG